MPDDLESRVRRNEETIAGITEALRFRAEMDLRNDQEVDRVRKDAEREQDRLWQMYHVGHTDHETRLRKLEHVAWATLGTASVSLITAIAAFLVKVWT